VTDLPVPSIGLRRLTAPIRFLRRMQALPISVAWFHTRARFTAWRIGDDAPKAAVRPEDLAVLLRVARGRREVVELGTAKAWTAISLALAQRDRRVTTYDPIVQPVRERYLALVPRSVRERLVLVDMSGDSGPSAQSATVDCLFIDASHERTATIREYEAWKPALATGALVVFDDYGHPDFPGVRQAVKDLELQGRTAGLLFVHLIPRGGNGRSH
jgi:predicted O-methyltransferase YrrM